MIHEALAVKLALFFVIALSSTGKLSHGMNISFLFPYRKSPPVRCAVHHDWWTYVRNIKKYLLAALYNAPATIDSYYASLVNHDLYGGEERR